MTTTGQDYVAKRDRAVVIGGGFGGLVAARVLADHYREVVVLDRDAAPDGSAPRDGAPQSRHTHGLLARGRETLEQLFPGIGGELVSRGAMEGDVGWGRWFFEGAFHAWPNTTGLRAITSSRGFLEMVIRERVQAMPNVSLRFGQRVFALRHDATAERITGVEAGASEETAQALDADLVVDASGRGSKAPDWLASLGYPAPEALEVRPNIRYMTRIYRREPAHMSRGLSFAIAATAENKRAGNMVPIEGDRWSVTLNGYVDQRGTPDDAGFLAFARSLAAPDIYNLISTAEPLTDVATMRHPASRRYLYEKLERFPEGLLVFGDAVCAQNPILALGMTVAALEAVELQRALAGGTRDLAPRFFRAIAQVIERPWKLAESSDLRFKEVEGKRGTAFAFRNWYVKKVHAAAHRDPKVATAFYKVANLIASPASLLAPAMVFRVLRANLGHRCEARPCRSVPAPATQ